jgi:hypothetical protein
MDAGLNGVLMKRAIFVVIVLAGGFAGYRHFFSTDRVEANYKAFAEEVLNRRYDKAAAMTDGLTAGDLEQLGSQERIGAGVAMFQTLFPSRFVVNSRNSAADGSVVLHVTQTVLFNPVGVESARPAMKATLNQVVTMRERDGEWKVAAFENNFESLDSLR